MEGGSVSLRDTCRRCGPGLGAQRCVGITNVSETIVCSGQMARLAAAWRASGLTDRASLLVSCAMYSPSLIFTISKYCRQFFHGTSMARID